VATLKKEKTQFCVSFNFSLILVLAYAGTSNLTSGRKNVGQ